MAPTEEQIKKGLAAQEAYLRERAHMEAERAQYYNRVIDIPYPARAKSGGASVRPRLAHKRVYVDTNIEEIIKYQGDYTLEFSRITPEGVHLHMSIRASPDEQPLKYHMHCQVSVMRNTEHGLKAIDYPECVVSCVYNRMTFDDVSYRVEYLRRMTVDVATGNLTRGRYSQMFLAKLSPKPDRPTCYACFEPCFTRSFLCGHFMCVPCFAKCPLKLKNKAYAIYAFTCGYCRREYGYLGQFEQLSRTSLCPSTWHDYSVVLRAAQGL